MLFWKDLALARGVNSRFKFIRRTKTQLSPCASVSVEHLRRLLAQRSSHMSKLCCVFLNHCRKSGSFHKNRWMMDPSNTHTHTHSRTECKHVLLWHLPFFHSTIAGSQGVLVCGFAFSPIHFDLARTSWPDQELIAESQSETSLLPPSVHWKKRWCDQQRGGNKSGGLCSTCVSYGPRRRWR